MEKIALLGMMASGKTTLGKILAKRLSMPFIDEDDEIERRTGMPIPEIFRRHREEHFRNLELQTVEELLNASGPQIVALGGGAYVQDRIRTLLRNRVMAVYLRVEPEELIRRLEKTNVTARPLLAAAGDWRAKTREIAEQRDSLYMDADVIFPANDNDTDALGERLAQVLTRLCRFRPEMAHA